MAFPVLRRGFSASWAVVGVGSVLNDAMIGSMTTYGDPGYTDGLPYGLLAVTSVAYCGSGASSVHQSAPGSKDQ